MTLPSDEVREVAEAMQCMDDAARLEWDTLIDEIAAVWWGGPGIPAYLRDEVRGQMERVRQFVQRAPRDGEDRDCPTCGNTGMVATGAVDADPCPACEPEPERGEESIDRDDACPVCGHEWRRHDPEDGQCDAGMPRAIDHDGVGTCPCGRDIAYHQRRNAQESYQRLGVVVAGREQASRERADVIAYLRTDAAHTFGRDIAYWIERGDHSGASREQEDGER